MYFAANAIPKPQSRPITMPTPSANPLPESSHTRTDHFVSWSYCKIWCLRSCTKHAIVRLDAFSRERSSSMKYILFAVFMGLFSLSGFSVLADGSKNNGRYILYPIERLESDPGTTQFAWILDTATGRLKNCFQAQVSDGGSSTRCLPWSSGTWEPVPENDDRIKED